MYAYIAASLLQRWYTSEEHTKKLQNIEKERQWHIRRCVRCAAVFCTCKLLYRKKGGTVPFAARK